MYRMSPSRAHRSKGIKVKHVLQLCLLLAFLLWLIYQVKHSNQKGKDFDSKDEKILRKVQPDGDIPKFGRKDLPRVSKGTTSAEKHGEDEEEKELEEEDNKPEEDALEVKHEEVDEGNPGDGEDEIDETDTERADPEPENEEESVDEDKEREENQGASDDHSENIDNENVEKEYDQDHDGDSNTHEAREEQYKADDASSEVTHEMKIIIPEIGNSTTGHTSELYNKVNFGQGNETQTSEKNDALILQSMVQPGKDMNNSVTSSNATVTEQKRDEIDLAKLEDDALLNSTLPLLQNGQPENRNNSADVSGEIAATLSSNGTQMEFPSGLSRNVAGDGGIGEEGRVTEPKLFLRTNRTENVNSKTEGTEALATVEDSSSHLKDKSNNGGISGSDGKSKSHSSEKSDNGGISGSDGNSESHSSNDISKSNPAIRGEVVESKTDFKVPEIRTELQSTNNTVTVA